VCSYNDVSTGVSVTSVSLDCLLVCLSVMELTRAYKARRDALRPRLVDKYEILGFISSGTYGRVYKARSRDA
jgi:hypothetical protein